MKTEDIVKSVLQLKPGDRFEVADAILRSLDQPDPALDAVWLDEAERRLAAYRKGRVAGIPAEDVVGEL